MSRLQLNWVVLLASGCLAGCASSQMSRIDSNRDLYETWPLETRQAVLDGKVEPGMTPDMVTVAWGKPSQVVPQGASGDEIWVYEKGGSDPTVMYPGGAYPGGVYPGGIYPGGYPNSGTGVTIGTSSRGGTAIGATGGMGIGMGGGMGSGIMGPVGANAPIVMPGSPPEIREVVFRNGVVTRADSP